MTPEERAQRGPWWDYGACANCRHWRYEPEKDKEQGECMRSGWIWRLIGFHMTSAWMFCLRFELRDENDPRP